MPIQSCFRFLQSRTPAESDAPCHPDISHGPAHFADPTPCEPGKERVPVQHAQCRPGEIDDTGAEPDASSNPQPQETPTASCLTPELEKHPQQQGPGDQEVTYASCDTPGSQQQPLFASSNRAAQDPPCIKRLVLSPQRNACTESALPSDTGAAELPHSEVEALADARPQAGTPLQHVARASEPTARPLEMPFCECPAVQNGAAASHTCTLNPHGPKKAPPPEMHRSLLNKVMIGWGQTTLETDLPGAGGQPRRPIISGPTPATKFCLTEAKNDCVGSENLPPHRSCTTLPPSIGKGHMLIESSCSAAVACGNQHGHRASTIPLCTPTPTQPQSVQHSKHPPAYHDKPALTEHHQSPFSQSSGSPHAPSTDRPYDALVLLANAADSIAAEAAYTPATAASKLSYGAAIATPETCPPPRPAPFCQIPQKVCKGDTLAAQHTGHLPFSQRAPQAVTPRPTRKRSRSAPGSRTAAAQSPSPMRHMSPRTPALVAPDASTPAVIGTPDLPLFKLPPPVALFIGQQPSSLPCTPVQVTARGLLAGLLSRQTPP
jgi:hypothetical protein